MLIAKSKEKFKKTKKCARKGCTNRITARRGKKYCEDPKCLALRNYKEDKNRRAREKRKRNPTKVTNLIIPKREDLIGKYLRIRCAAEGPNGQCKEVFVVQYSINRKCYPNYCSKHRNSYRRKLFSEGKDGS